MKQTCPIKDYTSTRSLSDDECYVITTFLDSRTILTNCLMISRQWYDVILRMVDLRLHLLSLHEWDSLLRAGCSYLDRIRDLSLNAGRVTSLLNHVPFKSMHRLEKLALVGWYITEVGWLSELKNLSYLEIDYCHVCTGLVKCLRPLKKLVHFEASWCSPLGSLSLDGIDKLVGLKRLILSSNGLGPDSIRDIATLSALTQLDLSCNKIGSEGLAHICSMRNLVHLDVSSNMIGIKGATILSAMNGLTHLSVRNNRLYHGGARIVSQMKNLKSLNIRENCISASGADYISAMHGLTHLDITLNYITKEGARSISTMKNLTRLKAPWNLLGNEGLDHISHIGGLVRLDIRNNQITGDIEHYASRLKNITRLDARGNDLVSYPKKCSSCAIMTSHNKTLL